MQKRDPNIEAKILKTATRLFFQEGKLNATMWDIANELSISRPVLNYYFKTRDDLLNRVYKDAIYILSKRLTQVVDSNSSFYDAISTFIESTITSAESLIFFETFLVIERLNVKNKINNKDYKPEKLQEFLNIVQAEMNADNIVKCDPVHFLVDMLSLITYPQMVGCLYFAIPRTDDQQNKEYMTARKDVILSRLFLRKIVNHTQLLVS